jgi:hypothetical protein
MSYCNVPINFDLLKLNQEVQFLYDNIDLPKPTTKWLQRVCKIDKNGNHRFIEFRNQPLYDLHKYGKIKTIKIHILVAMAFLGHKPDGTQKIVVDHIDNNPLNNNLTNLQLISQRENVSKDRKNGSSQYTGVSWGKNTNKWRSIIYINNKVKHLGLFTLEEDAAKAYQNALKMLNEGDLSFMEPKEYSSKYKCVYWVKNANKWRSQITINGKKKHLGYFTSEEEAHEAYQKQKMNAE